MYLHILCITCSLEISTLKFLRVFQTFIPTFWILRGKEKKGKQVNILFSVIVTCAEEEFKCVSSQSCIEKTKLCNGIKDCPYGEDEEQNCSKLIN